MSKSIAIFNRTMRLLEAIVKKNKALNTAEIANIIGQSKRTAQRTGKALSELGWLEVKTYGGETLYRPSKKTKQMFSVKGESK